MLLLAPRLARFVEGGGVATALQWWPTVPLSDQQETRLVLEEWNAEAAAAVELQDGAQASKEALDWVGLYLVWIRCSRMVVSAPVLSCLLVLLELKAQIQQVGVEVPVEQSVGPPVELECHTWSLSNR